ncbi:hypothetical protein [Microbacterium sp.]|uniref:hypothetical protein n=1 Tax=Microbacterium sp. TaxID=51671 RepID=UPI0039E30092
MTSRLGVGVMAVCLALYIVVVGQRSVVMLTTKEPVAIAIGIALLVMPLVGAWALYRELRFGVAADRLGRTLDAEGGMPQAESELTPSGRIARDDAEPIVSKYAALVDAAPTDWRAHYRLGVVQDAAGRRKDARASIREAIRLERV